jgi:hypothetical protein
MKVSPAKTSIKGGKVIALQPFLQRWSLWNSKFKSILLQHEINRPQIRILGIQAKLFRLPVTNTAFAFAEDRKKESEKRKTP